MERKRRGEPSPTISASTGTDRDRDTSYSYYSSPGQDEPDTRRTSDEDDYDDEESYQDENCRFNVKTQTIDVLDSSIENVIVLRLEGPGRENIYLNTFIL